MDRAAALAYIANEFPSLIAEAGLNATDDNAGFKVAIDSALRNLSYAEADLETADETVKVSDYLFLLDYYALRKLVRQLSMRSQYQVDGQQYYDQQLFAQAKAMLDAAEKAVKSLGYNVNGGIFVATYNLDFLEPDTEF